MESNKTALVHNSEVVTKKTVALVGCSSCYKDHKSLPLLDNPAPSVHNGITYGHHVSCPVTGDTVLIAIL